MKTWRMSLKVLPDNLAEWLKRSPAKRLDYVLTGSNPVVVAHLFGVMDSAPDF